MCTSANVEARCHRRQILDLMIKADEAEPTPHKARPHRSHDSHSNTVIGSEFCADTRSTLVAASSLCPRVCSRCTSACGTVRRAQILRPISVAAGRLVKPFPSLDEVRARVQDQLASFREARRVRAGLHRDWMRRTICG